MTQIIRSRSVFASFAFAGLFSACSAVPGDGELVRTQQAKIIGIERTIPVRFIHLMDSTATLSPLKNTNARISIDHLNEVYNKAHVQFEFAGIQAIAVSHTLASSDSAKLTRAQISDLTDALGISSTWCADCTYSTQDWIESITTSFFGTDELIAWLSNWGGNEVPGFDQGPSRVRMAPGSIGPSDPYKMAHEVGHMLGLRHTHDLSPSCDYWDLVYFAAAGGTNRFFTSKSDCEGYMSTADSTAYLQRIDPRDAREPVTACTFWNTISVPAGTTTELTDPNGDPYEGDATPDVLAQTRTFTSKTDCRNFFDKDWNPDAAVVSKYLGTSLTGNVGTRHYSSDGVVTITLPCRDCSTPLTYSTGDSRITGYVRRVGASNQNAANVMGYNSKFPTTLPMMIGDSQVEVVLRSLRSSTNADGQRTLLGNQLVLDPLRMLDFDGDGVRDLVTWQAPSKDCSSPSDCPKGTFTVYKSSQGFSTLGASYSFGIKGDIPVLADYDGDGRTDLAVYRPGEFREASSSAPADRSFWLYCASSLNYDCSRWVSKQFGLQGDVPIPGTNFVGSWSDGEAAVFRPSEKNWYYGAMCKPGSSGTTTCSTAWNGPFRLGTATSYLMPDLWDADERTDFAIYDPATATFKLRRSETSWDTITIQLDSSLRGDQGGSVAVPQYRRYWDGSKYLRRRTLGLYNFGTNSWLTSWYWWNADGGMQSCSRSLPNSPSLIGGLDIDKDDFSDHLFVYQSASTTVIRGYSASTSACNSSYLVASAFNLPGTGIRMVSGVADMSGDHDPDLLIIDPAYGQAIIMTLTGSSPGIFKQLRIGGPGVQFL
ncbi:MAG TPA: hypothetical protein VFK05_23395 [Polyangiaceae bacterium]|nr:hypothetical protein [Polyangiaceae bacterium]